MRLRSVRHAWDQFFFTQQSPLPIAWFRILYGLCVATTVVLLHKDWLDWFGVHSWVTLATAQVVEPGIGLSLFSLIPQNDTWIAGLFWFMLGFCLLLTVGLWTRLSSVAVFLCLDAIGQRNLFITHGGDTFLRVAGFFLIFAPAGAALSVDRLLRVRKGLEGQVVAARPRWAQRMIQLQLSLVYISAFCWKLKGHTWLRGTALFYVLHLHGTVRFPLPGWVYTPAVLQLAGWAACALEFALGALIWFRRLRYPLLGLGLLFHLCIEYSLNLPMFEWDILSAYVLFVDPADLTRAGRWLRQGWPLAGRRGRSGNGNAVILCLAENREKVAQP